jgi:hypothetical protein
VTLGDFEEPLRISIFVKDLFAGFSMVRLGFLRSMYTALHDFQLNLKNDILRRRFDSLKYDIKKIEEGTLRRSFYSFGPFSLVGTVVYDVSLRKL